MHASATQSGFALLMTIIVVGVVTAIGLSVLDLSIKQVRLTTLSRDSENAFHAANAGLECARFNRLLLSSDMEAGDAVGPTCFGTTLTSNNPTTPVAADYIASDGQAYLYTWQYTWGTGLDTRCSRMNILVASTTPTGSGIELDTTYMGDSNFPGYVGTFTCEASARCTVISVQGFNKACSAINQPGTVQREVLLEF
jgi:Tfp pilus assembly protein PilX